MDPFASNNATPAHTFPDDHDDTTATCVRPTISESQERRSSRTGWKSPFAPAVIFWANSVVWLWNSIKRSVVLIAGFGLYLAIADTKTHCRLGVVILYSGHLACSLPAAIQMPYLSNICEWMPQLDDDGNICVFNMCCMATVGAASQPAEAQCTQVEVVPFMHDMPSADTLQGLLWGASIVVELTSPTHGMSHPPFYTHAVKKVTGITLHKPDISRPDVVLTSDVIKGRCWEVHEGGQIGIRLNHSVNVTQIAINYADGGGLTPAEATKRPKDVSLWGLVALRDLETSQKQGSFLIKRPYAFLVGPYYPTIPGFDTSHFIHLGRYRYNPLSDNSWQYFPVDLDIPVQVLILVIESTWGAETACLYTIEVY